MTLTFLLWICPVSSAQKHLNTPFCAKYVRPHANIWRNTISASL